MKRKKKISEKKGLTDEEIKAFVRTSIEGPKLEDWMLRAAKVSAYGDVKDIEAVESLIEALNNDSMPVVRQCAAEALGKIGDPRAMKPLTKALNDKAESVRKAAAKALNKIGE